MKHSIASLQIKIVQTTAANWDEETDNWNNEDNWFHLTRRLKAAEVKTLIRSLLHYQRINLVATTPAEFRYAQAISRYIQDWIAANRRTARRLYRNIHKEVA